MNKQKLLKLRKQKKTLKEIGVIYNISSERVRQIIGNTGSVKNAKKQITCAVCGKKFKTYNNKYCSVACATKGKRKYTDKPLSKLNTKEWKEYWKRKYNKQPYERLQN